MFKRVVSALSIALILGASVSVKGAEGPQGSEQGAGSGSGARRRLRRCWGSRIIDRGIGRLSRISNFGGCRTGGRR